MPLKREPVSAPTEPARRLWAAVLALGAFSLLCAGALVWMGSYRDAAEVLGVVGGAFLAFLVARCTLRW